MAQYQRAGLFDCANLVAVITGGGTGESLIWSVMHLVTDNLRRHWVNDG